MKQGDFVWYELCTPDPGAAAGFYAKVIGWQTKSADLPDIDYTLISVNDRPLGSIMSLPPEQMPPRPVWLGYVAADDVDAATKRVETAGGAVRLPPQDIPSVGRFAVVADPQGAVFILFKSTGEPLPPINVMQPGSIGWHELHAADWEKAWEFYGTMFGWEKDRAFDMGGMGQYQLFKTGSKDPVGGMLSDTDVPHPYWLFYFAVEDIDAAQNRVTENGGNVLSGPMEVPGGAWVITAQDPQSGLFALVGMRQT